MPVLSLLLALAAVPAAAQEWRVAPRDISSLRAIDRRITSDVREGVLRRRSVREDTLVAGRTHERFDQYVRGVRIYGADLARQLTPLGQTVSVFGTLYDNVDLDTSPALTQADAKRRIETLAGAELGDTRQPELLVLPLENGRFALAWHERAVSPAAGTLMSYFIDADTGALLLARNELRTQGAVGRGTGVLGDDKKMSVASGQAAGFVARDQLRPPDVETFDLRGNVNRVFQFLNGQTLLGTSDLATDSDNVWTDTAAVDAHVYTGFTYDYFFKRFGRRGLNDNNLPLTSIVHPVRRQDLFTSSPFIISLFFVNAGYWGDGVMVYGEGLPACVTAGGQSWDYVAGALDIVAHELTHGVTEYTSDLIYENEPGALNEAFSDIMGASAEYFFQERGSGNLRGDWLMGEDVVRPGGLRNMANPAAYGDPDHYSVRYTGTDDNGGVHINSSIVNLAFQLAVDGGAHPRTGTPVAGVGFANREQIERVYYRAFTQLMPANTTFSQARAITIQAARDLFGSNSAVERAVADGWTAVGVN